MPSGFPCVSMVMWTSVHSGEWEEIEEFYSILYFPQMLGKGKILDSFLPHPRSQNSWAVAIWLEMCFSCKVGWTWQAWNESLILLALVHIQTVNAGTALCDLSSPPMLASPFSFSIVLTVSFSTKKNKTTTTNKKTGFCCSFVTLTGSWKRVTLRPVLDKLSWMKSESSPLTSNPTPKPLHWPCSDGMLGRNMCVCDDLFFPPLVLPTKDRLCWFSLLEGPGTERKPPPLFHPLGCPDHLRGALEPPTHARTHARTHGKSDQKRWGIHWCCRIWGPLSA